MSVSKMFSLIPLIAANSVPLFGVVFFGWNLQTILFGYWFESAVIGLFNAAKLFQTISAQPETAPKILVPFFFVHYAGFMAVHFIFLSFLIGVDFTVATKALPFVGSLFLSHGSSFFLHFVRTKKYETEKAAVLFFAPYSRIIIMHLTVLGGGVLIASFGSPVWTLLALVGIKTLIDVLSHTKEHHLFSVVSGIKR